MRKIFRLTYKISTLYSLHHDGETRKIAGRGRQIVTSLGVVLFVVSAAFSQPSEIDKLKEKAEQGDAAGQFNLGVMYAAGRGVPKDYVQAHMWLNLAATNDFAEKKYAECRDKLAAIMTPEQITEAQKLAWEWYAAHQNQ